MEGKEKQKKLFEKEKKVIRKRKKSQKKKFKKKLKKLFLTAQAQSFTAVWKVGGRKKRRKNIEKSATTCHNLRSRFLRRGATKRNKIKRRKT